MNLIRLVKMVMRLSVNATTYDKETGAFCPVCVKLGLKPPKARITSTQGEVRYCTCPQCCHNFRAIGEKPAQKLQEVKPEVKKPRKSAKKARKKNRKKVQK